MALSPADFYAYSRATGVPVPEDPYERAELAPQVLEFRRNQLKAPQPEQNIAQALGTAALGTAAAIGAGLAARRFFGGGRQVAKPAARPTSRGVTVADLKEYTSGPVEKIATTPSAQAVPKLLADPWGQTESSGPGDVRKMERLRDIQKAINTPQWMLEVEAREQAALKSAALVNPSIPAPGTTANALEIDPTDRLISEFQEMRKAKVQELTGRMSQAYGKQLYKTADQLMDELQGESLTAVQQSTNPLQSVQANNALDSGANQVAGRIERREGRDPKYDPTEAALLGEEPRSLTSQELADVARDEMIARRQAVEARGLRPGTQRFERALAADWTSKPNLEPGSEKFNQSISLPTTIRNAVEAASADPLDPLGGLKERALINIGPDAQIEKTAAGTAIRGASATLNEALPKRSLRELLGGDMGPDIPGSQRVRGAMGADVPPTQLSKQEITYSFLNQAPEPEIPGGSAGIGVYGIDPNYVPGAMSKATGAYSAAASRKPSDVPKWLVQREATPFSSVSNQALQNALGKANKGGAAAITNEINRRQVNRESVAASEALRRARIEGRDPQMILRQLGVVD